MSQWGAYGRAVNGGQTWQQILDAYYGGTISGTAPNQTRHVRLVGFDGR
jgi:peptidoglycan hydrolase-like amidase